jgi:hypothetical protein
MKIEAELIDPLVNSVTINTSYKLSSEVGCLQHDNLHLR